ncbi:MAG TPA: hypothetical protein VFM81_04290 [Actinomycetota bacterium]|nr:hypothetical protein [Actinomycetota bacterium]
MTLRRRRLPDELREPARAFADLVPALERAKAALTDAVPGTRLQGRPLAEALWAFESGLREVVDGMDGWRAPEVETEWTAARAGLDESLTLAERLRTSDAAPRGFEELIGVVGDLLAPLEAFEAAAARFRELRR